MSLEETVQNEAPQHDDQRRPGRTYATGWMVGHLSLPRRATDTAQESTGGRPGLCFFAPLDAPFRCVFHEYLLPHDLAWSDHASSTAKLCQQHLLCQQRKFLLQVWSTGGVIAEASSAVTYENSVLSNLYFSIKTYYYTANSCQASREAGFYV